MERKRLGEVCEKVSKIRWQEIDSEKEFQYVELASVKISNNKIEAASLITALNAPSRAQQIIKTNDVLLGITRPTLKRHCIVPNKYNEQICSTGFCVLRANRQILYPNFLFYLITTEQFYTYLEENQEGTSYPTIAPSVVFEYSIPLPPLSEQARIVSILDKFDTLVNSLCEGLPREIDLRHKQYEYYRDQLLTFPAPPNANL